MVMYKTRNRVELGGVHSNNKNKFWVVFENPMKSQRAHVGEVRSAKC